MSPILRVFKPCSRYKTLSDVPIEELAARGIHGVLLDIDNTLVPYGDLEHIPDDNRKWLERAKNADMAVILYSNATQKKIDRVRGVSGLDGVPKAYKPGWGRLRKALKMVNARKDQVVMVGDQLCTDILGGNLCGVETILVEPLTEKDWWGTNILRMIEWIFLPDRRPWGRKRQG